MSRSVSIFASFVLFLLIKSANCEVKSCYACAGPENDCNTLKMTCNDFQVDGKSLVHIGSEPELLERFDAEVGPALDGATIGCLSLTFERVTDVDKNRAIKTCLPEKVFGEDVCTYMEQLVGEVGGQKPSCRFCLSEDCNSGAAVLVGKTAFGVVCLAYVIKIFLY